MTAHPIPAPAPEPFEPPPPSFSRATVSGAWFERLVRDPNPTWAREMKQLVRLGRTPIVLTVVTVLIALLICAVGGLMSVKWPPAAVGVVLYHVFFSCAFFVVAWIGPAVAANSIAAEREGRTWEAVVLTGMRPVEVGRGKFLSALTTMGLYVAMLVPVGALPFLFGGVGAVEVVLAFALLFGMAALAVGFGLAVSSAMSSVRTAIAVTLILNFPASVMAFALMGSPLAWLVHESLSPAVGKGPVWLPSALARAPVGAEYFLYLVAAPLAVLALPTWFFYEVSIANLTGPTDDRSTGLKRWFLVTIACLTLVACGVPIPLGSAKTVFTATIVDLCLLWTFLVFVVFLFVREPLGPSRRVLLRWDRAGAGSLRRLLGPGHMRTSEVVLVVGTLSMGLVSTIGLVLVWAGAGAGKAEMASRLVAFAAYATAFFVFLVGCAAWLRARHATSGTARAFLIVVVFCVAVGPWLAAGIAAGILAALGHESGVAVAGPSPFYAFVLLDAVGKPGREVHLLVGAACGAAWVLIGLALLAAASARTRRLLGAERETREREEAALTAEEAARAT